MQSGSASSQRGTRSVAGSCPELGGAREDTGAIHPDTSRTHHTTHALLVAVHLGLNLHTDTRTQSWSTCHLELNRYS